MVLFEIATLKLISCLIIVGVLSFGVLQKRKVGIPDLQSAAIF